MFILKTREGSPNRRKIEPKIILHDPIRTTPRDKITAPLKLVDENMQLCDASPLQFLLDQKHFLVVGSLGLPAVGKSTVLSSLVGSSTLFPVRDTSSSPTSGVDIFVTDNRVIYLDAQPILSPSNHLLLDYYANPNPNPNPNTNPNPNPASSSSSSSGSCSSSVVLSSSSCSSSSASAYDQTADNNNGTATTTTADLELRSLQFAAFLFSVCHVVLFVQDWFLDPNLIRFLRTAEMLKPSSTTANNILDQDYVEYYPHLVFLHNKAELQDFAPDAVRSVKKFYEKAFATSRLRTRSGLDMTDRPCSTEPPGFNFFLLPRIGNEENTVLRRNEKKLVEKLKTKIHGVDRTPITPNALTEKNWYHYVSRVIDAIKKSHLSSEYGRLMP